MNKTKIEYLTHTWNPLSMRCTPVSAGCASCWHLAMAKRLAKNPMIDTNKQDAYKGGATLLDEKELEAPLHLGKPARIGVQFMGDLFYERIPSAWIMQIINQITRADKHQFFILTKRIDRTWTLLADRLNPQNLWLGVSAEDQKTADERIPTLLQIPAAHRWVSVEPMLGPVDLWKSAYQPGWSSNRELFFASNGITWIVAGGETGPGARPLHPDWVRSLRDQCQAAGVPFFFKGWGEWGLHKRLAREGTNTGAGLFLKSDGSLGCQGDWWEGKAQAMDKVGHKHSGHLLDGKEYREVPK